MKKLSIFFITFLFVSLIYGQIPAGYYDDVDGQSGAQLKTVLYTIIKDHTVRTYDNLWSDFQNTDKKVNGKVWDTYSDVPGGTPAYEWTFGSDQCGNYSGEGSCYNREHSFPKSWFNDASPMYTELFHIYPTDGYVNGKRSNYPFGEVSSPTWTSTNGSKLGPNSTQGYSGTVFEPIDEYKGDFARTYFYMATRYENIISNWNSDVLDGSTYPVYVPWHLELLIRWSEEDPVSEKEVDRNNAIYLIQHNRNPFIDHPEYVASVWGTASTAPVIGNIHILPQQPSASETVTVYGTITDNGSISGATLNWGLNSGSLTNQLAMQANGNEYSASIPPQADGTRIYYSITAVDNESETNSSSTYSYLIASPNGSIELPINEDFENGDLGVFSPVNVTGVDQTWIHYTYSATGNSFAKVSGYNGSETIANEDWLVTPLIDFDSYTNETMSFRTSMNYSDQTTTFKVLYSDNYSGTGNPNLATWNDLSSEASFSDGDYNWVQSGTIDLSFITGSEITIAFKYTCGTVSETWQLDDILIAGSPIETGLDETSPMQDISIYPNPTTQWIQLKGNIEGDATILIFNYLGQLELEENLKNTMNQQVYVGSLKAGVYILQINAKEAGTKNLRLLIQK